MRRARKRGETLTQYIQQILEREVARPSAEDVFERIAKRTPVLLSEPVEDIIRQERLAVDERLDRVLRGSE